MSSPQPRGHTRNQASQGKQGQQVGARTGAPPQGQPGAVAAQQPGRGPGPKRPGNHLSGRLSHLLV